MIKARERELLVRTSHRARGRARFVRDSTVTGSTNGVVNFFH
jgi:hypothetical protein